jgi:hypothetical protein
VIEGDFSGWLFLHSQHPIKVSFSPIFPAAVAHEYRSAKRLQRSYDRHCVHDPRIGQIDRPVRRILSP